MSQSDKLKFDEIYPYIDFIDRYQKAENAATGSDVDSNANVECKTIATLESELYKKKAIEINRCVMYKKLSQMYGDLGDQYINDLQDHIVYRHDETANIHAALYSNIY